MGYSAVDTNLLGFCIIFGKELLGGKQDGIIYKIKNMEAPWRNIFLWSDAPHLLKTGGTVYQTNKEIYGMMDSK